jgi:hypothetical protein
MTTPIGYPGALRGVPTWPALGATPTAHRCQNPPLTRHVPAIRPVPLVPVIAHKPKEKFLICTCPVSNRVPCWLCPDGLFYSNAINKGA